MAVRIAALFTLYVQCLAVADPLITAAARLAPRQADPSFVGYISESGGFSDPRSCDYPQTVSTSGSYVQCCPTTGDCAFYTSCSGNTLFAASTSVPCDFDATLTCNTGVVLPTVGAADGGQYLACWQKSLGSSPFTFVQDIGSASVSASSTSGSSSGESSSSSTASSGSSGSEQSSSQGGSSPSSTSSSNGAFAAGTDAGLSGGVLGAIAFVAQMLL